MSKWREDTHKRACTVDMQNMYERRRMCDEYTGQDYTHLRIETSAQLVSRPPSRRAAYRVHARGWHEYKRRAGNAQPGHGEATQHGTAYEGDTEGSRQRDGSSSRLMQRISHSLSPPHGGGGGA